MSQFFSDNQMEKVFEYQRDNQIIFADTEAIEHCLTCPVCFQVREDLIPLGCGHHVCLRCMEIIDRNAINCEDCVCPVCRQRYFYKPDRSFFSVSRCLSTLANSLPRRCTVCDERTVFKNMSEWERHINTDCKNVMFDRDRYPRLTALYDKTKKELDELKEQHNQPEEASCRSKKRIRKISEVLITDEE